MNTWYDDDKGIVNFKCLDPIELPNNLYFEELKDQDLENILPFIKQHYNNDFSDFSLEYTIDHLKWYFNKAVFNFIVLKTNDEIIGCISGKCDLIYLNNIEENVYIINYLCIHKNYRKRGLLNYLIAEIGRLALIKNIYTGIYISKNKHSKPLCKVNYFLHYKNPEYLHKLGLLKIPIFNFSNEYFFYTLKLENINLNYISIEKNKIVTENIINKLNEKYVSSNYKLSTIFNKDMFNNNYKIITTFTLELTSRPIAFVSYYNFNLIHKDTGKTIKQAYILYYWNDEQFIDETSLFKSTINELKDIDIIVTNDIGNMAYKELRKSLKIDNLGSYCYYYLCNKSNKSLNPEEIALFIP